MGEEDTRRQALNVARMRCSAPRSSRSPAAAARSRTRSTRRCATGSPTSTRTHYLLGTVAGPHPFPVMVRDFQRVIGVEARAQMLELTGRLPDAVAACVGGGSNAIGIFHAVPRRPDGRGCTASRPAATASRPAGTRPRSPAARPASCTARAPTCCRTRWARPSSRTRSPPASTTRASGPSTPGCTTPGGATYRPVTDAEAMDAFAAALPHRGHHPGDRERARARRRAASSAASSGRTPSILVNLSGRGDKDVDTAARWFGLVDGVSRARGTLARPSRGPGGGPGRADRLPAGRLPDGRRRRSPRCTAMVEAGVDVVEVGLPVLRPADGRPDDPGAPPSWRSAPGHARPRRARAPSRRWRRPVRRRS